MAETKRDRIKKKIKDNPVKSLALAGALTGAGVGAYTGREDYLGRFKGDFGEDYQGEFIEGDAIERLKEGPSHLKNVAKGAGIGGLIGGGIGAFAPKEKEAMIGMQKVAQATGLKVSDVFKIVKKAQRDTPPEMQGLMAEREEVSENEELKKDVSLIDGLTDEEARKLINKIRG